MASSGKKKTTMAKLNRERKLRERRLDKQAKKDARKQAALYPADPADGDYTDEGREAEPGVDETSSQSPQAREMAMSVNAASSRPPDSSS